MTSTDVAVRPDVMVQHYVNEFAQVLPSHVKPEMFVRLAVGALRRDRNLMRAAESDPTSLMSALLTSARLGLEPGTKEFWLTPRKVKGRDTVIGFPGYEGYIELIYRAGAASSVKAELVHENDEFRYEPGTMDRPAHKVNWFGDRGRILGAYAYAELVGGGVSRVAMVGPDQIARAKSASAGSDSASSPWSTDYGPMVLKTAVRQLAKWVPTSAEYRREQLRAVAEVARETAAPVVVGSGAPIYAPAERIPTDVPGVVADADGVIWDEQDPPTD